MWEEIVRLRKRVEAFKRADRRKMDRILYLEGQVRRMLHEASLANQIKIMAESYKPKPWYVEDPEALFNQLQRSEERRFYYMQENERLRAGLEVPVPDPWFEV